MRTLLGALLLLSLAAPSRAQLSHSDNNICTGPSVNTVPVGGVGVANALEWCEADPMYSAYAYRVTAGTVTADLAATCTPVVGGGRCVAPIPPSIAAVPQPVTLKLVASLNGLSSAPALLQLPDPVVVVTCHYVNLAGMASDRAVGDAIGGYLSNNVDQAAKRVAQLRRDGWRVEWQYVPGPTVAGDRIVVMFTCVGPAQ